MRKNEYFPLVYTVFLLLKRTGKQPSLSGEVAWWVVCEQKDLLLKSFATSCSLNVNFSHRFTCLNTWSKVSDAICRRLSLTWESETRGTSLHLYSPVLLPVHSLLLRLPQGSKSGSRSCHHVFPIRMDCMLCVNKVTFICAFNYSDENKINSSPMCFWDSSTPFLCITGLNGFQTCSLE